MGYILVACVGPIRYLESREREQAMKMIKHQMEKHFWVNFVVTASEIAAPLIVIKSVIGI